MGNGDRKVIFFPPTPHSPLPVFPDDDAPSSNSPVFACSGHLGAEGILASSNTPARRIRHRRGVAPLPLPDGLPPLRRSPRRNSVARPWFEHGCRAPRHFHGGDATIAVDKR